MSGRARRDKGARYEFVMSPDFSLRSDWLGAHDPCWGRSLQAEPLVAGDNHPCSCCAAPSTAQPLLSAHPTRRQQYEKSSPRLCDPGQALTLSDSIFSLVSRECRC